ncbi:glycosyltransferase [Desulforamulus ruminis]|uniref:glycosyltransferase n=1 Tax=Desulforamulus ruminis TaxID=1564 RepID=UPI0023542CED|nr:glycosyltransferase [Desulforamulus ruminis]
MKVLHITNMYPWKEKPWYGIFIANQIKSLDKYAIKNDVYFINGNESKISYLKALVELKNYRNKYDLIHCHHGWCGIIANLVLKNERKVLSLVGGDLLEKKILYKRLLSKVLKSQIHTFDHIIVKSDKMLKICDSETSDISCIPNGVNMELFNQIEKELCKEKLKLCPDKKYFLFTAAANDKLRTEKRYDIIKKAEIILKSRGITGFDILFLENLDHKDVPYYINACEAVLLSSDYEGSPNIIKEALACNVPIISTDVGNVDELVRDLDNCYIVEQSSEVFANYMEIIMSKSVSLCKGRMRLKELKLDEESVAKSILSVYQKILK